MKAFTHLLFILFLFSSLISVGQKINNEHNFISGKIIIKLKSNSNYKDIGSITDNLFNSITNEIETKKTIQLFPKSLKPTKDNSQMVDISTIYTLEYSKNIDPRKLAEIFSGFDFIEYAQPYYIDELTGYIPNDPMNNGQYYLTNIHCYDAWELPGGKGDSTITIGIVDTGIDNAHNDLIDNIQYNYNDPIDGLDNDNDGYTDNFRGWDIAENDNNPNVETNDAIPAFYSNPDDRKHVRNHGIYVSGAAAARTDNNNGISGPGFKCKFLPIKILSSDGILTSGYEGIVYAADHGCQVINCSWGGFTGHPYGQDIVNYVTFNRNALVIASAGNSYNDIPFYPASYENVLNVAATNSSDMKWNHSSFGYTIDVSAPGEYILMTDINNSYMYGWGTSFASPIVAGCTGIVRNFYPTYSALQIGEKLRITCDYIDTLNPGYEFLLGKGRINLYRALTETNTPSVRYKNVKFAGKDDFFRPGDTISIQGIYVNYLDSIQNAVVTLSSSSPYVTIINAGNNINLLGTMDTLSGQPEFLVKINDSIPYDERIVLKLTYLSQTPQYYDFQFIEFNANLTIANIDTNNIIATLTSKGRIGYNKYVPYLGQTYFVPYIEPGFGFRYKLSETLIYEAGLMIANSNMAVSNCIREDEDFIISDPIRKGNPPYLSDIDYHSVYKEVPDSNYFNVLIKNNFYAWNKTGKENFIITEYQFINQNLFPIQNFYAGLFCDWDIINPYLNKVDVDSDKKMSYCFYDDNVISQFGGIKLLTSQNVNHYALDNVTGGAGGIDISNGFSNEEKYISLSNNRIQAGPNDICDVISAGPLSIAGGDTVTVAFALIAGESLYSIQQSAIEAQKSYDSLFISGIKDFSKETGISLFPNPAHDYVNIICPETKENYYSIEITNQINEIVFSKTQNSNKINIPIKNYKPGVYFITAKNNSVQFVRKLIIL